MARRDYAQDKGKPNVGFFFNHKSNTFDILLGLFIGAKISLILFVKLIILNIFLSRIHQSVPYRIL